MSEALKTMKFRKKPVVIEAFQMTKERRMDNIEWPEWLNEAWNKRKDEPGAVFRQNMDAPLPDLLCIQTLEGVHLVQWGDWIIQGVKGELYPCKPDIFAATYEPAALAAIDAEAKPVVRMLTDVEFAECCGGCKVTSAAMTWMCRSVSKFAEVNGLTIGEQGCNEAAFARFAALHIKELCAGVEPVYQLRYTDGRFPAYWTELTELDYQHRDPREGCEFRILYPASTVAALKARVAELEKDAAPHPIGDIMKGSVAQHLDAAIDEALRSKK